MKSIKSIKKIKNIKIRLSPRLDVPVWVNVGSSFFSLFLAFTLGGALLFAWGINPIEAYTVMIKGALGSWYGISEVVVKAIPMTLTAIAGALCYKMQLWNIGMEGQLALGALATVAAVRFFPLENDFLMTLLMLVSAMAAGGLWAAFAGFLKAKFSVNEIITTLMMNYIGLLLVDYFIYGAWKDPTSLGFPMTSEFPEVARLVSYFDTRIHSGIFIAIICVVIYRVLLRWTQWGYEIRVIGENQRAAGYAGMNIFRNIVIVMFLSGAVAGLAGMSEIAGLHGRIAKGFSVGHGYAGIIVAWLARLNAAFIPLMALLMGALQVGGENLQIAMGIPLAGVQMFQGLVLFCLLIGETLCKYKINIAWQSKELL